MPEARRAANVDAECRSFRGDPLPVNLPPKPSTDPRLLALLSQIAGTSGHICLAEDEFDALEREHYFRDAAHRRLLRVDEGGEWSTGTVISITREGRMLIGELPPVSLWKRLGLALRRHPA